MNMNSTEDGIPLGLGMALAQNSGALSHFASLSKAQRQEIVERTHGIESKKEMKGFVDGLAKGWNV